MKKSLISMAALLVALVGCNKETHQVTPADDGQTALIKVSLNTAGTMTKADPGTFVYGSDAENLVKTVRFYFFDASNAAYNVQGNSNCLVVNNLKFNQNTEEGTSIEEFSDVVLVIKQTENELPAKMAAVINAPADLGTNLTLAQLQQIELDALTEEGAFVMSSSTYVDGTSEIFATEITDDNVFVLSDPSKYNVGDVMDGDDLKGFNPVQLYVERVAARVDVKTPDNVDYFEVRTNDNSKTLYAHILGWQVTNHTEGSNLIKDVNPGWTNLGFDPWNVEPFHRSYWANTEHFTPTHDFTFNEIAGLGEGATAHNLASDYYFENTGVAADTNIPDGVTGAEGTTYNKASQLVVAVQLTEDVAGNKPAQLGEMYGIYYTINDLKAVMLSRISSKLYKAPVTTGTGEDAVTTLNPIDRDDVEFEQASATALDNRYEVRIVPKSGVTYYKPDGTAYKAEEAKAYFDSVDPAKMWTKGYTYYYTTIQHFGDAKGIVRNHVYDITISSIQGLGTPVYNPGLVITPEITDEDDALSLAAQINILSWHLVSQNVTLQ